MKNIIISRGRSWRRGPKCDCKIDWLWVRSPLEEMKYLFIFTFSFPRSSVEIKDGMGWEWEWWESNSNTVACAPAQQLASKKINK